MDLVFVSTQPICVFWLEHLIHLYLKGNYWFVCSFWHFLNCFGFVSLGLFLLLCFPPRESPLAFVVKLFWWWWILLAFAPPQSFWFLSWMWMRSLLGRVICRFSPFIILNIFCHSLLACRVHVEKLADNLMGIPLYVICCFSLVGFNVFSLNLVFVSLIKCVLMCFFLG